MSRQSKSSRSSNVMQRPVLVLNAAYEPLHIASAKRALILLVKGKAFMEVELDDTPVHVGYTMPSVVRLVDYRHIPHSMVMPKRANIYMRDGHMCQYCGETFSAKALTLDHVVPRAHGGPSTWENLVAACKSCNSRKADRTPSQAGMPLLRKPRQLTKHTGRHQLRMMGSADPTWQPYLYH